MAAVLNSFAVCVNSSFDEGQCVAVYDAALCGCALCLPKIMSFIGVFSGKALFHEPTDSAKLAENLLYYLQHPGIAEGQNERCRQDILRDCSEAAVEANLKKLFTL